MLFFFSLEDAQSEDGRICSAACAGEDPVITDYHALSSQGLGGVLQTSIQRRSLAQGLTAGIYWQIRAHPGGSDLS